MKLDLRERERRALANATLSAIETDAGFEIYSTGRLLARYPERDQASRAMSAAVWATGRLAEVAADAAA